MAIAVVAIALAVVLPALLTLAALNSAQDARAAERHAADVSAAVDFTERLVVDLETGQRGFVLTGEERFLEPWTTARDVLPIRLARLRESARQGTRGHELAVLLTTKVRAYLRGHSTPLVALARRDRRAAASAVRTAEGKALVDDLRGLFSGLRGAQSAATSRLDDRAEAADTRARVTVMAGAIAAVALLGLLSVYLRRSVTRPLRRLADGAQRLGDGELAARAEGGGARELATLSAAFNDMAISLQASQLELIEASDAKSEFLSRMSHELRTPLNAILGFGQLLEMDELGADQMASIGQVLSAGRHLLALIDEVLEISRIEAGTVRISVEPISMRGVIADVQSMVAPVAAKRDITVIVDPAGAGRFVLADQQRVKQILLNLLTNAINYNRDGGTVTVRCSSGDGLFRVSVSDTGPGIADEDRARLFVPFERLGAEGTLVEGTGLGLALSQRFAKLMSGSLEIASSSAEGTTFVLSLPLADSAATATTPIPLGPLGLPASGARMTVVYAEDNPSNARLVERIFTQHRPVRLFSTVQGNRALELAREHLPELILLDLHLPDLPGEQVLGRLKADPATAAIPVVVISADATPGQVSRLLHAGAAAYLTKPLDVREFLAAVDGATGAGAGRVALEVAGA
jgi:signal transduction histidine kinase/AmiR/NasT family two-component response regulator